jgi:hypothetical protein
MSKVFFLVEDLKFCYHTKARYVEDYLKLSKKERDDLCKDVKESLIKYVNSNDYAFKDYIQNLYNFATSNNIKINLIIS